jgi:hypothetical protein
MAELQSPQGRHMSFVVSGVLLALMVRVSENDSH